MTWRPWRAASAPILITFSRKVVSDHCLTFFYSADVAS
jgi:hypothetical protein